MKLRNHILVLILVLVFSATSQARTQKVNRWIPEARAVCNDLAKQVPRALARVPLPQRIQAFATTHRLQLCRLPNNKPLIVWRSNSERPPRGFAAGTIEHDYLTNLSPNIIELTTSPRAGHLYVRIGRNVFDNWPAERVNPEAGQNGKTSVVRVHRWGTASASTDRLGALVELTTSEMDRLKEWVDASVHETDVTLGSWNYGGGDPRGNRPGRSANCTSWISYAPIGDNGQTLGDLAGVGNHNTPSSFLTSLMSRGNERVQCITLLNPSREVNPANLSRYGW
ncbi:MAG: hypothetical protein V1754_06815 [Pseudomonadota bacterium]